MRSVLLLSLIVLAQMEAGETVTFALDPARPLPKSPGFHEVAYQVTVGKRSFRMPVGVFLPLAYFQAKEPMPVVMILHNYGEKGNGGGDGLKFEGLQMLLARNLVVDPRFANSKKSKITDPRKEIQFVGLVPQCPGDMGWESDPMNRVVPALVDEIARGLKVDPDRAFLTGFSYGGSSTWALALASPDRWAAIIPVSGRRPDPAPAAAEKLKHLPIFIGYGTNDADWAIEGSKTMAAALKTAGCKQIDVTVIPDGDHWSYMYMWGDPAFWTKVLACRRAKPTAAK